MPGIARWMLRLESVKEFFAVYLNSAAEAEGGEGTATKIVTFDNTLELSDKAASGRFQRGVK